MSSDLPPIPPRPDLPSGAPAPVEWRQVHPGHMGARAIVGAGMRIWAANWFPWFVVTLAMSGVIAVLIAALDPWTATYGADYWIGQRPFYRPDPNAYAVALTLVSVFFLSPWEIVILTRAALRATFSGPPRGTALIGRTIRGVHSLVWIFVLLILLAIPFGLLLVGILTAVGHDADRTILAFIPLVLFLWLVPRLATLSHVFVGEDARGIRAISGAWRLSKGHWATSAGTVVLTLLIAIGIGIVPGVVIAQVFPGAAVAHTIGRTIVQSILNAILTPMGTAIVAALYLELRARKNLLDQGALRTNLARFD